MQITKQVFTDKQGEMIEEYLKSASSIYFGLAPVDVRRLAYDYATQLDLSMPELWIKRRSAGPNCFASFMKRYPKLSIRQPKATSLSRET